MTLHFVVLAATLVTAQAATEHPDAPREYSVAIVKNETAKELSRYANDRPVVIGEDKDGYAIVIVLDIKNTDGRELFKDDPGDGPAYTSASRCVINTSTVWYLTKFGYIDSGETCSPKPVEFDEDQQYAGENAPYLVIRRYPLSNRATRELLELGIRSEAVSGTNKEGTIFRLLLNPSIAQSQWIHLACVSVASSQVKCYKNSERTKLCHKDTQYIYNKDSGCPNYNQSWVKKEGTKVCSCP